MPEKPDTELCIIYSRIRHDRARSGQYGCRLLQVSESWAGVMAEARGPLFLKYLMQWQTIGKTRIKQDGR